MLKFAMRPLAVLAIPAALAVTASSSFAAPTAAPTTFGNATFNQQGVLLVSNPSTAPGYSGIDIPLPAGTTLNDINSLDATYQVTQGDCNVGSPRFTISLPGTNRNIFAYFGNAPEYHCDTGTVTQSNLLLPYVDDSQINPGGQQDTYAHAQSLAGTEPVTDLFVVLDGGYASPQAVEIYSLSVNGTEYNFAAPTSKDQCKNGGWQTFINPGTFKNQGDCVSYVATHGKNPPNG